MGAREVIDTLTETLQEHGPRAALRDLSSRALDRLVHLHTMKCMVVELADLRDPGLFEAPGFHGRWATPAALQTLVSDPAYDLDEAFLRDALARRDRCYVMFDGGRPASYGWYSTAPTAIDDDFVVHFDPTYTYMYKGFTLPEYRGRRLHGVGMCQALRALADEGQRGLVSFVASNNFASLKSTARVGYRIFGDVYMLRAGSRRVSLATPGCTAYRFRAEARPGADELTPSLLGRPRRRAPSLAAR